MILENYYEFKKINIDDIKEIISNFIFSIKDPNYCQFIFILKNNGEIYFLNDYSNDFLQLI